MKNFEFNYDPEEVKRKKKFPQHFENLSSLLDDQTLVLKNLGKSNNKFKDDIDKLNKWTIKNM